VEIDATVSALCTMSSTRPREVQDFISNKTGQKVQISDVYNLKQKVKGGGEVDEEQLKTILEDDKSKGGNVNMCVDENEVISLI
jgi:hypothetical protein